MNKENLFNISTEYKNNKYNIISYKDIINFTIGKKNYSCFLNNLEEVTFEPSESSSISNLITIKGSHDGSLLLVFNNGVHEIIFEKPDEKKIKEYFKYIEPYTKLNPVYDHTIKKVLNKNKSGIRRLSLPLFKEPLPKKIKVSNNFLVIELSDEDLIISGNLLSYKGNHLDLNRVIADSYNPDNFEYIISEKDKDLIIKFNSEEKDLIDQLKNYIDYIKINNQ